jgi:hypothetical protein
MTTNTVQDLRTKIDAIESKKLILTGQRDDVAFAALVDREPRAVKQAADINAKLAELTTEESMLNAALKVAVKRETEARAAAATESERQRAEEAQPIAERLAKRGQRMDEAMAVVLEERAAIDADAEALARLGVPVANADLRRVNLRRWIDAATSTFDKHARPVAPRERCTADSLTTGWMRSSLQFIADKLNKAAAKVAA